MTKENTDFQAIASNGKKLKAYVTSTIKAYASVATRLHQAAAMTLWHALEHREASALNAFYEGLRVNDQTALRVWVATHTRVPGKSERNPGDEAATLIGWNKDKGFIIRKGLKSEGAWVLAGLLAVKPFYQRDIAAKADLTIEALLAALAKAGKSAETRAEKNGLELPAEISALIGKIDKVTSKAIETLAGNDDKPGAAARSNVIAAKPAKAAKPERKAA